MSELALGTASRHVSCHALGLGGCGGAGDDIAFVLPWGFGEKGMCIRWFTNHSYWSISFDEAEELHNESAFPRIPNFPFCNALVSRSMVALASAALCGHLSVLSNKHPETCSETPSP